MKYLSAILISAFFTAFTVGCDQGTEATKVADAGKTAEAVKVVDKNAEKIAEKMARGMVFEYGIYNAQRKGRVLGNLTTNTGKVVTRPVLELSETTDRIPLVKDTYFAYRYRLLDLPKEEVGKPVVELRKVLIHPPMNLPDGTVSTGWDRMARGRTSAGQVIAFDGYVFSEDYELVEGDWTFQIWFQGKMLVEQTFTVYQPDEPAPGKVSTELKAVISTAENKI
jgi:Domain of unknown function (DUF3859)